MTTHITWSQQVWALSLTTVRLSILVTVAASVSGKLRLLGGVRNQLLPEPTSAAYDYADLANIKGAAAA